MSERKPTIVFVPGSFCPVDIHYAHIISLFRSRGYDLVPIPLPSTTKKPGPAPTMYDDAAYISAEVTKLADEGKEVVLVGHSYGGTPVTESLKGLSKAEREGNGKKGGVVRIGYITSLVPELGGNAGSVMIQVPGGRGSYMVPDEDGWLYHSDRARVASVCFTDLSLEEGIEWSKKFSQHTAVSFTNELTYAGYNDVPVSWLFAEKDKTIAPQVQQVGIDNVEKASGKKVEVTRIPHDHMPHVSAPQKVVDWMVSLVEKGSQEA